MFASPLKVMLAVLIVVAAFAASGCGASVGVSAFAQNDAAYRAMWAKSWEKIKRDEAPWIPTKDAPGACNVGGTKQGCYDTDQLVIKDLKQLSSGLGETEVPPAWRDATAKLQKAIATTIKGLQLRDDGIAHNDQASFSESRGWLGSSTELWKQAWAAFPNAMQPSPAPQI